MRTSITRSINETSLKSVNVKFKGGKAETVENPTLIISGLVNDEKALKLIRKAYGEQAILVSNETQENAYEISVEDFIKYATKVEPKAETKEV